MLPAINDIGSAVIRYGAQMAIDDHNVETGNWGAIVYGAPAPSSSTWQQQATTLQQQAQNRLEYAQQAATRDEWWKWAAGVGLVSMAAYIIYQKVTEKK